MLRYVLMTIALMSICACSLPVNSSTDALVHLDSRDFGQTNLVMQATETDRQAKTSTIKVTYEKGGSVGSSMFIAMAFYKIAQARGSKYFVNLKEWQEDDGSWMYIGGFTNKRRADIKKEFGEQYSDLDEEGEEKEIIRAKDFDIIFRGK
jgi:hypothetical protein